MNERRILANKRKGIDPSESSALDVAFYDGSKIVIRSQEDWKDGETPIGIVVVPGYHDRYGDGTCGIMSLVGMDYNNPETGIPVTSNSQTDNVLMCYGYFMLSVGNNIFSSTTSLEDSYRYIPYQISGDSTACYGISTNTAVWPYAGTITAPTSGASTAYTNTNGYVTATTGKAGCDFNGIRNTAALYVATIASTLWTANTVRNYSSPGTTGNTPAAACCGRFKTVGTKSFLDVYTGITSNDINYGTSASTKDNTGYWYLPAEGELCYLPSKRFEINKTILALNQKYGNVAIKLDVDLSYTSSSHYNSSKAWYVGVYDGDLNCYDKNRSALLVRAFMRI